jgi:hypothetical protein
MLRRPPRPLVRCAMLLALILAPMTFTLLGLCAIERQFARH